MTEGPTDVRFRDRAAYLGESKTLVVADLHLGRARTPAIDAPLDPIVAVRDRLRALVRWCDPRRVVFAGDVLDAFESIPPGVVDRFGSIVDDLASAGFDLVLLRGNHDLLLAELADAPIEDVFEIDGTVVLHGHEEPPVAGSRYVIGHAHPAIRIEGVKRPCYLYGPACLDGRDLLVLPAFSRLARGATVNAGGSADDHSPLVRAAGLDGLHPIVETDDDPLVFPPLATLRTYL